MNENDFQKLTNLSKTLHKLNGKVKLLALLQKAKNAYDANNYAECLETCKKVLKKDPNNAIAYRGLGCVMQSTGNNKKAIEYYFKALENSKNKEIEYTLIGTVYYNENNLEKAIENYNLASDINDDYDPAYEGRNQSMLENHLKILDLQDSLIKQNLF